MPLPAALPFAVPIMVEVFKHATNYVAAKSDMAARAEEYALEREHLALARYEARLRAEIECERIGLERERIDLERERLRRQHEIVLETLRLVQHAFDRQIDAYMLSFTRTASLVERERDALRDDLNKLEERLFSGTLSKPQMAYINKRRHDIRIERDGLLGLYQTMRVDFETKVQKTTLRMTNPNRFISSDEGS